MHSKSILQWVALLRHTLWIHSGTLVKDLPRPYISPSHSGSVMWLKMMGSSLVSSETALAWNQNTSLPVFIPGDKNWQIKPFFRYHMFFETSSFPVLLAYCGHCRWINQWRSMMKEKKNAPCRQSVSLLVAVVDYDRVGGNEMIGGWVKPS